MRTFRLHRGRELRYDRCVRCTGQRRTEGKAEMPSSTKQSSTRSTPAERKAATAERKLAERILRMRKAGTAWDGENGIVAQGLVSGAPKGRALLRKYGLDAPGTIAPSYDRTLEFRAAESARRTKVAAPAPKRTGKAAKPRTAKRAPRGRKVA